MNSDLQLLIQDDQELQKIVKFYIDPVKKKPERLVVIQNVLDKYIPNENEFNNIVIKKITDKYKNELKNFKYATRPGKLLIGQEIIFVSRKTQKISKLMDIVDIKKNDFNEIVGISVKSKRARTNKYIAFLKNYIFKYVPIDERSNIRDMLENFI